MWFPGGIAIGSLMSGFMTDNLGIIGRSQVWLLLVPTIIYAVLFFGQAWPKAKVQEAATIGGNLKAMATPLFLFIAFCMTLTAISEFGPNQWVGLILAQSGAHPMLILALTAGLMAVARYFGGDMVKKFDQVGVLLGSAILATLGIYLFSTQTGAMAYVAAIFFALGIAYFWPNMIGFVASKIPKSGALGMSIIGAIGMFMNGLLQPIIGGWIDSDREAAAATGLTGDELILVSGQNTLEKLTLFPGILIILFTILYFWMKSRNSNAEAQAQVTT